MKPKKTKRPRSTNIMYAGAIVVVLFAIAFLINNIILFKNTVAQYVAQGYNSAEVIKGLLPGQLLPGIFEPIAIYGGIAFLLFCAGIINQKVSKCLEMLDKVNSIDIDTTDIDTTKQTEAVEENSQVSNETQQSQEN